MKLVLTYLVGDNCTWSADIIVPFHYSSVAEAEESLRSLSKATYDVCRNGSEYVPYRSIFHFAGHPLDCYHFWSQAEHKRPKSKTPLYADVYNEPRIQTLDDWFESGLPKTTATQGIV